MASAYLDEFKTFVGLDTDQTDTDATINLCLNYAEQFIAGKCNISTVEVTEDISFTLPTTLSSLYIDKHPVTSINSVTINGTTQDISKFYMNGCYLETLPKSSIFESGINSVVVNVTYGYATLPDPLKEAMFKLAYRDYTEVMENRDGMHSYSTGNNISEKFTPTKYPVGVLDTLKQYTYLVV